jgi:hypothetical protein
VLLLILSYLILRWLSFNVPAVQQSWQSLVIDRGLSVPLLAMVLGGTLPVFLNLFWQEDLQNLKSDQRFFRGPRFGRGGPGATPGDERFSGGEPERGG